MSVTHGMNPDEVEYLGRELQVVGRRIEATIRDISALVNASTWAGEDAILFRQQWWPEHLARLHSAASDIDGFGQSALNNASAQRAASGAAAGTGSTGPTWTGNPGTGGSGGSVGDWLRTANEYLSPVGTLMSTLDEAKNIPLAGSAGGVVGAYGKLTDGFSIAEQIYNGEFVDASLDGVFVVGDISASVLKTQGPLGYVGGVAVQAWTEVGRAATDVDWSGEGLQQIADASLGEWADALGGAFMQMPSKLVSILG